MQEITAGMQVDRYKIHDIEIVVDRLQIGDDRSGRLAESVKTALKTVSEGLLQVVPLDGNATEVSLFPEPDVPGIRYFLRRAITQYVLFQFTLRDVSALQRAGRSTRGGYGPGYSRQEEEYQ
jgi:excinuclease UvrABC ATPase subunit